MKGQHPDEELAQLHLPYCVVPLVVPNVNAQRCLICISASDTSDTTI
jgi:hypothetical protein